jgi:hypothetical protein
LREGNERRSVLAGVQALLVKHNPLRRLGVGDRTGRWRWFLQDLHITRLERRKVTGWCRPRSRRGSPWGLRGLGGSRRCLCVGRDSSLGALSGSLDGLFPLVPACLRWRGVGPALPPSTFLARETTMSYSSQISLSWAEALATTSALSSVVRLSSWWRQYD